MKVIERGFVMLTDIQIAQQNVLAPITEIAKKLVLMLTISIYMENIRRKYLQKP